MPQVNRSTPRAARPGDLHEKVRARRTELGLDRQELASAAGVTRRTVQRLERGEHVSADTVVRIERGLGLAKGTLVPGWRTDGSILSNAVGALMRERRRELGISLVRMAASCDRTISYLSRLERGVSRPVEAWEQLRVDRPMTDVLGFRDEKQFWDWIEGHGSPPRRETD